MVEKVSTGGTRDFVYGGEKPSLSDDEKEEIRGAYDKYYERRRIEKKRRNVIITIAVLIILIILFFVLKATF